MILEWNVPFQSGCQLDYETNMVLMLDDLCMDADQMNTTLLIFFIYYSRSLSQ